MRLANQQQLVFRYGHGCYRIDCKALQTEGTLVTVMNGACLEGSSLWSDQPVEVPPWRSWLRRTLLHHQVQSATRLPHVLLTIQPTDYTHRVFVLQAPLTPQACQQLADAGKPVSLEFQGTSEPRVTHKYLLRDLHRQQPAPANGISRWHGKVVDWPATASLHYRDDTDELISVRIEITL